jgi:hypothetical protein
MSTKLEKREEISGNFEFGSKKQMKNTIGFSYVILFCLFALALSIVYIRYEFLVSLFHR